MKKKKKNMKHNQKNPRKKELDNDSKNNSPVQVEVVKSKVGVSGWFSLTISLVSLVIAIASLIISIGMQTSANKLQESSNNLAHDSANLNYSIKPISPVPSGFLSDDSIFTSSPFILEKKKNRNSGEIKGLSFITVKDDRIDTWFFERKNTEMFYNNEVYDGETGDEISNIRQFNNNCMIYFFTDNSKISDDMISNLCELSNNKITKNKLRKKLRNRNNIVFFHSFGPEKKESVFHIMLYDNNSKRELYTVFCTYDNAENTNDDNEDIKEIKISSIVFNDTNLYDINRFKLFMEEHYKGDNSYEVVFKQVEEERNLIKSKNV